MSPPPTTGISPRDLAQVEAWADSSFPDRSDDASIVVHGRGLQIHVEEQRPRSSGGVESRTLIRLRFIPKAGTWVVHRAVGGGRWIGPHPLEGSLATVLEGIDLRNVPPH